MSVKSKGTTTMPEPTPEAWAQIRHDYEHTDRPLAHICAEHGIPIPTMRYRMKRWEWKRRKPLIPREGPPPVAVASSADSFLHPPLEGEGRRFERQREPSGWGEDAELGSHPTPLRLADASRSDPPPPGEGEEIVPRLRSAIARVLPAIEATIARLAEGPQRPRDMEQAGRALSSLIRALRELNALLAEHKAREVQGEDADNAIPQDMDAFRLDLAQRLTAIINRYKQEDEEAKLAET
jgi:hypothetical protein